MARKVVLIVLAAWGVTPSAAQVLRGSPMFFSKSSWSSSWSSSFNNGKVVEHQEVKSSKFSNGEMMERKEAKSSTFSNGVLVEHKESSVGCAHGRCSKSVTLAKPGSVTMMTQEGLAAGFAPESRFIAQLPWPALRAMPETQPQLIVTKTQPQLVGTVEKRPASILFLVPHTPGAQANPNSDAYKYLLLLSSAILMTLIGGSLMMWRISEALALPSHPLSEPLAQMAAVDIASNVTSRPAVMEAKVCADSVEPTVKDYLEQMYARAAQHAHVTTTKLYLSRVYAKSCM